MSSRSSRLVNHLVRPACKKQPRQALQRFQSTSANTAGKGSSKAYRWVGLAAAATLGYQCFASVVVLDEHREDKLGKSLKTIEASQIAQHTSAASCWIVIDGIVWDVTNWLDSHPGGSELILEHAGKDVTQLFQKLHPKGTLQTSLHQDQCVGRLCETTPVDIVHSGEAEDEIQARRNELPPVDSVVNVAQFESLAKQVLGEDSREWRYFSSYCDDGVTYNATRDSFSCLRFVPRVNRPVKDISSYTSYFGGKEEVPLPIWIAPTGQNRNGHPDGELNALRAAAAASIPQGVSNGSSVSMAELLEARDELAQDKQGRANLWYQHYIKADRKESEKQIRTAHEQGADAIILTVDVPALGNREADRLVKPVAKNNGAAPAKPDAGLASAGFSLYDANMSWNDIEWARKQAPGTPIVVKGISSVADVVLAYENKASGVMLSNHGGRQLEYAPAPLAVLLHLHKERPDLLKKPDFDVFIDGGVYRGTDILKAVCLGAKGVGLGRAVIYAQTCYGDRGVTRLFEILRAEFHSGMRLLGANKISDLQPNMLELLPHKDALYGEQLK